MKKLSRLFRYLIYIMPLMLIFSYFPLMKLGENETMYFELSLPLMWLVLFDIVGFIMVILKYWREIFTKIFGSALFWLFPLFVTFSVIWSLNPLRGFLTVGVMWAVFFAVLWMWEFREQLDAGFWRVFFRWFFGSAIFVSLWCVVQCVLNTVGVSQEALLLCDGCVYQMFGFPRANGFAIEPQFMGNLLLAPILVILWMITNNSSAPRTRVARARRYGARALFLGRDLRTVLEALLLFVLSATLFLTMSRGAIYAGMVGVCFLFAFSYFGARKAERKKTCFSILKTIGVILISFAFALNLQGIFAASSPTNDTYLDGVSKVLNQLSLGVIDLKGGEAEPVENSEITEGNNENVENGVVENSEAEGADKSIYDGYVEESTDTRVRLFNAALSVWRSDFKTIFVGVGIGGAGQALYDNGLSPAPREIVQNEYASLLLETGVIGVSLFVILVVMVVRVFLKSSCPGLLLALVVAYGVSLLFFSGLTNALQIVLLPGLLVLLPKVKKC